MELHLTFAGTAGLSCTAVARCCLSYCKHPVGVPWCFVVVLIRISLLANDAGLFGHLCISLGEPCYDLGLFFTQVVCLFAEL